MLNLSAFKKTKKPVLHIHIGMNKTGTTALQNYLEREEKALGASGVLYPKAGRIGAAHYSLSASLGFCNPSVCPAWKVNLQDLKRQFVRELSAKPDKVVFSSEDFILNRPAKPLLDFFEGYPLRIVVYLRRHDHWWISAYAQAVKMKHMPPWNLGPVGFINHNRRCNKHYGDYRHLLDRWAKVVGKENVIVRPYEAGQNQPDLAADFLSAIELKDKSLALPPMASRDNASLSVRTLHWMDIFQRVDTDPETRQKLLAHAHSLGAEDQRLPKEMLNPQFLRKLVDGYQADYEYIARHYLGREDGRLFYDPLPEAVEDWKAPTWPTQPEVAREVLKAIMVR
ncbi:hypothetical protein [Ectothiorhodospira lacustris]|uniref:hypothetical protein n=1 Tax=Ectothiorhodospira lacustris TaxID=2899127 RepID=UPI001EE9462B|nr:hypothetical protein [Ectothiorhodospira lacustris]MCG5500808.1 hypothetical protein [Ectothiorhodospira lacustris]